MRNVTLILDDGSRFSGKSFGYEKPVAGEVVFNTAMTGYRFLITERLARETAPVVEDQCYISHLIYLEWLFFRIDKLFLYSL